jgi:pyruvate ferredoxin oxidoreductase alpha subunit
MLKQVEGSQAVAEAVALCRPEVICAYPISPQTHIVEGLGERVKSGSLERCEFINVESEFAAMSVAIGASAAGARAYTATASQGLLFMAEAVFNASGLGLPIVMTVANRAIGAPINIWNDHTDAMSQRDCGWIQLFAETNQEALDLHIQAFRLAEELSLSTPTSGSTCPRSRRWMRISRLFLQDRSWTPRNRFPSGPWSARKRSPRCATSRMSSRCRRSS